MAAATLPNNFYDLVLTRGKVLRTPDGEFPLVQIGKGAFSTIYESVDRLAVVAVVAEGAYEKEILAMAHEQEPKNPHIPAVMRYGTLTDGRQVFTMPRYTTPFRVGNATAASRKAYTAIRECLSQPTNYKARPYEIVNAQMECMRQAGINSAVLDAMEAIHSNSLNYGDQYRLELSPRNAATDAAGNLVLLDVLFDQDLLRKQQEAKRKAQQHRYW